MAAEYDYRDDATREQTAERVDAFVRRQALWTRLRGIFQQDRPSDDQLRQSRAERFVDETSGDSGSWTTTGSRPTTG